MKLIHKRGGSIALLLLGEIGLRLYGFAEAPLYKASDSYEYIAKPNQDIMHFGNHIHYNSYSVKDDFRDGIHLSKSGQRKLADIMKEIICKNI